MTERRLLDWASIRGGMRKSGPLAGIAVVLAAGAIYLENYYLDRGATPPGEGGAKEILPGGLPSVVAYEKSVVEPNSIEGVIAYMEEKGREPGNEEILAAAERLNGLISGSVVIYKSLGGQTPEAVDTRAEQGRFSNIWVVWGRGGLMIEVPQAELENPQLGRADLAITLMANFRFINGLAAYEGQNAPLTPEQIETLVREAWLKTYERDLSAFGSDLRSPVLILERAVCVASGRCPSEPVTN